MKYLNRLDKSVLFCWHLPPPIGGISIIAERLCQTIPRVTPLSSADLKSANLSTAWSLFQAVKSNRVVVVNGISARMLYILLCAKLMNRIVFSIEHNQEILVEKAPRFRKFIRFVNVILADRVFYVCQKSAQASARRYAKYAKKIRTINPYISPGRKAFELNHHADLLRLDHPAPIFGVSCYKLRLENGLDFYGIREAIELVSSNAPGSTLVIISPDVSNIRAYVETIPERRNIECLFFGDDYPLTSWLQAFDIFIRLTFRDGFGLSIYEALDAGVKVIVSKGPVRPVSEHLIEIDRDLVSQKSRLIRDFIDA